ncbi:MAG: outer membrane beta-barrel protein, partial [Deltaproteobacteria bacterium]|nr:outer membrane beta-barrel protein [Deltaproteobacteria bacterium]
MKHSTLGATLLLATLVASSAAAESGPAKLTGNQLRIGGFVGYDFFDEELELGNSFFDDQVPQSAVLIGLRAGLDIVELMPGSLLAPTLGVELESKLAFSQTEDSAQRPSELAPVLGWRAHLMASFLSGMRAQPFLVVGAGGETVFTGSDFIDSPDTDASFHWGAGARYLVTPELAVRLDYRMVVTAGRFDYRSYNHELHVGASYRFELFGDDEPPPPPPKPTDSDGDGILDDADTCPDQPEDKDGYEDQDGCPDTDNDGDDIADGDDQCPLEAETVNQIDDDDGCPETDPDGDGLLGSRDGCPDEAEDRDGYQDGDGCPDRDNDGDG